MNCRDKESLFEYRDMRYLRDKSFYRACGLLLSWALLVSGCTQTRPVSVANRSHTENVAFTTTAARTDIVDAATSVLVQDNFSLTLVNERIGLLQTGYVPLSSVRSAMVDTIGTASGLEETLMSVTVNVSENGDSRFVRLKGSFQMIPGARRGLEPLVGLYWLDRVADTMAGTLDVEYKRQLSDSTYASLISGISRPEAKAKKSGFTQAAGVIGLGVAILFAITLAVSTFSPGSQRTVPTQAP